VADEAVRAGVINASEAQSLKLALAARLEAIEVDVFTPDQFYAGLRRSGGTTLSEVSIKESDGALVVSNP
jgi:acyl-CoA dehydrogenase